MSNDPIRGGLEKLAREAEADAAVASLSEYAARLDAEQAEHEKLQREKLHTIGGTDAAVIALETAGKPTPYGKSMFDVWLRMTGRAAPQEDSDRLEMGRLMEEPIATRFSRKTGFQVEKLPQIVHPRFPWYTGHIDRAIVSAEQPGDLECKSVEWDPLNEWSEPGEEQRVPLHYLLQVTWYIGLPRDGLEAFERMMYAAAQFGLSGSLRIYKWWPDEKIQRIHARMFESAQRFYETYVLKDEPPPMPVASPEAAKRWLEFRHPTAKDEEVVLVTDTNAAQRFVEAAKAFQEATAKAKLYDAERERLKNELAAIVGDHYGATAISGGEVAKVTWPTIDPITEVVTDYEGILLEKGITVTAEEIANHSRTVQKRAGYRRASIGVKPVGQKGRK